MCSIKEIQLEIIEDFEAYDEWLDKYQYLIELGDSLSEMPKQFKDEEHIINGCQSKVWLHAEKVDGKIKYYADSDAVIVKGIVSLLVTVLNNRTPDEILNNELFFIDKIGLQQNLSPTRSNGLVAMMKKMKTYAIAFQIT